MHAGITIDVCLPAILGILKDPDEVRFSIPQEKWDQAIALGTLLPDGEFVTLPVNHGVIVNGSRLSCQLDAVSRGKQGKFPDVFAILGRAFEKQCFPGHGVENPVMAGIGANQRVGNDMKLEIGGSFGESRVRGIADLGQFISRSIAAEIPGEQKELRGDRLKADCLSRDGAAV